MPKPRIHSEETWREYIRLYSQYRRKPTKERLDALLDFRASMRFYELNTNNPVHST